ncbi:Eco57I restriction-modification methylase domain-containing protein [Desulfovibrio sp. ZJ200]|uniref:Eco57I restriction-modification methylase domain-containing protein n=1 Tax=Desulfovibrio sp. ZJ200 TaxID=2709792 RepID=UPI0019802415|nr:Eco57I restriction-modification methylase domain-containing protein [Desulfovibrio sp. ZJ200]
MKFDVIIGNPPYQLSDGGAKASAKPIYQKFIGNSKKLNPNYLSMIIPSRWFSGGKGLDEFRDSMLNDACIKTIIDYTDSKECFDTVDIAGGICYFLRDKNYNGKCTIKNITNGKIQISERNINEFNVFIRYAEAANIIRKVRSFSEPTMNTQVSSRKPFGLNTSITPIENGDLLLRYNKGIGKYSSDKISIGKDLIKKWKTIISYVSYDHAGKADRDGARKVMSVIEVLPPNSVCSETYLVAGSYDDEISAIHLKNYLKTKFVRFLVAQVALSQHITKNCFSFVPIQNLNQDINDIKLYQKYNLSQSEIEFIDKTIN